MILSDIFLIFTYGNGGFTDARFYLFLPFVFIALLAYGIMRILFGIVDGFKKVMSEERRR
jgi:hypothetical protein